MTDSHSAFVDWFRRSAPYIHTHRGKTFVINFGGEIITGRAFSRHVHDFALLNSLGIRLILVHGIRPQIEERLRRQQIRPRYHHNLRITDAPALQCVKEAAGIVRVELEALLSMGLPNSPMAGAKIRVATGNYVVAKPLGVHDGVDFQHTGLVRKVDVAAIQNALERQHVVLLSPIGYSPSGEVFNLRAEQVATAVATAVAADKLMLLTDGDCAQTASDRMLRQLTTAEARSLLQQRALPSALHTHLDAAIQACEQGVQRVHLINHHTDGALLQELFTYDGAGTLVSAAPYECLRPAGIHDINGILSLLRPLQANKTLVTRSHEELERSIEDYRVIERDGLVIGCAALHTFTDSDAGELACLALHSDYRGDTLGERLLEAVRQTAHDRNLAKLFVLTTQTAHWFRERGFEAATVDQLPAERRTAYNTERNARILMAPLNRIKPLPA